MKRTILITTILISAIALKAQMPGSYGYMNGLQPSFGQLNRHADTSYLKKKWYLTSAVGFSAGLMSYGGGNSSFLSAPIGVQLNRQLNNNVIAFAGVSVAPSYFPRATALYQPGINKNNGFMFQNSFGNYSTAQMGLMYINSERTFSISGSIGVGRSDFFGGSPFYSPGNFPGHFNKMNY